MIRKTWRIVVAGAIAATALALPGTANASTSACTLVATGAYVPLTDLAAVAGAGVFECLVDGQILPIGDLADPNAPGQYIDVSLMYSSDGGTTWTVCVDTNYPLVEGVGTGAAAALCPSGPGYQYLTHVRARVVYATPVTSASSTIIPFGAPNGCVHDSPNSITCYAGATHVA